MATRTSKCSISTRNAARIAGVSFRQLDYWCRTGLVSNESAGRGSGSRRMWSLEECQRVAQIGAVQTVLGSARLDVAMAIVDGDAHPVIRVGEAEVEVPIRIDLDGVADAVAEAWPTVLAPAA